MNQAQQEQHRQLHIERAQTHQMASNLRGSLNQTANAVPNLPTAGLICNLVSVVNAWEAGRIDQIDQQLTDLRS